MPSAARLDPGSGSRAARYLLRVWLPDRPGALGAVASRIGAVGADVVAVEVVDRGGGLAIDEFEIELTVDRLELCLREIHSIDGVDVEEIREVDESRPDVRLAPFDAAVAFVGTRSVGELAAALAEHSRRVIGGDWAAVCDAGDGTVHAAAGSPPPARWLGAYAMGRGRHPGAEGLDAAEVAAVAEADRELATASVDGTSIVVVVSRVDVELRPRERRVLTGMADLAAARWRQLAGEGRLSPSVT